MTKMIDCVIDSIRVSLLNQQRVIVLRDNESERYLPIWIGLYEAEAITLALQKIQVSRPQTHDLIMSFLNVLDTKLLYVEIYTLKEDVFYANLVLEQNGEKKHIDCRPSDAIALAVRTSVKIFVEEEVLTTAGISPEEDLSGNLAENLENKEDTSEDLEVFEDFLGSLNLNGEDNQEENPDDEHQN